MALKIILSVLISLFLISGCVSSKDYKACLSEVDALKGNIKNLEDAKEGLIIEGETLKKDKAALESDISGLKEELVKKNAAIEELKNVETKQTKEIEGYKHVVEASRSELVKLNAEQKKVIGDRESKIKGLEENIRNIEAGLKAKESELGEKIALISAIEADLRGKDSRISALETDIETLREESRKESERKKAEVNELKGTYDALVSELNKEIGEKTIAVTQLKDRLSLSMVDKVLFDSGKADINADGKKVLDRVAEILKNVTDKQIVVEGHTDNVAIGYTLKEKFPSNWELSSRRATNVVRYLTETGGIEPVRLSAASFAEFRPVASNDTSDGKARNRRIEIMLLPLDFERAAVEPSGSVK